MKRKTVTKKKIRIKKPLLIKKKKVAVKKAVKRVVRKKRVPAVRSLVPANKTIDTGAKSMIKRKKTKTAGPAKKISRKRRNSSGPKVSIKSALMDTAAAVGGAVVGSFVANKLPVPAKFKAAIPVALGILLQTKLAKNNKLLHHIGTGLLVVGSLSLIRQFVPQVPLLAGEEDLAMLGYPQGALGYVDEQVYGEYNEEMQGDFNEIDE